MSKILIFILIVLFSSANDANYHLYKNLHILKSFYQTVNQQSIDRNFPIFRGRKVISHDEYSKLNINDINKFNIQIVLSEFFIVEVGSYSEINGVSVKGILTSQINDRKSKIRFFKFDPRYFTDLKNFIRNNPIYSYCVAPTLSNCILLGIGENW